MSKRRSNFWLDDNGYDHVSSDKLLTLTVDDGSNITDSDKVFESVMKLMQNFPKKTQSVVNSALKRATSSGQAIASKAVREEYSVSASGFSKNTKSSKNISVDSDGNLQVAIKYAGHHISLVEFKASKGADGIVYAKAVKGNTRAAFEHAFFARFGSDTSKPGIYERNTKKRFPIHQLWGPSAAQMMWSSAGVRRTVDRRVKEMFEKRLEHEVLALMNGWRK